MQAKADKVLEVHDRETAHASLQTLQAQYGTDISATALSKMAPLFEWVSAFTSAVSGFVQADPALSGMVGKQPERFVFPQHVHQTVYIQIWAAILVSLERAIRFKSISDQIVDMLGMISQEMPRFEKYLDLYTASPGLQPCMKEIYNSYATFCIYFVKFFRHKPLCEYPNWDIRTVACFLMSSKILWYIFCGVNSP